MTSTQPRGTAATARKRLQTRLRQNIREKIRDYRSSSSGGRPGLEYIRREIDIQIRPTAGGFNFDDLLDQKFFDDLFVLLILIQQYHCQIAQDFSITISIVILFLKFKEFS